MKSDAWGLVLSFVYVFGILFAAEGLRKWRGYPIDFTRKFVHIGVGMWVVGTVLLFESRYIAVIPPLSFVALNYISYRRSVFQAMETGERENLGTVYFPISFALLILWLWPRPELLVAALMPMTWGDALAAIAGGRWGRHKHPFAGSMKSWEGSLTMFLASWLAVSLALLVFSSLGWWAMLGGALIVALAATVAEAITPWHLDNLTVPLISAAALTLLL